jgi:hypothetical protein
VRPTLALLVVTAVVAEAQAQPPGKTRDKPRPARKSPVVALGWSLGLTVVGSALLFGGIARDDFDGPTLGIPILVAGPSVGRWYGGGRDYRTFPGLLLRGMSAFVGVLVFANRPHCTDECTPEEAKNFYVEGETKTVLLTTAGIFFASAIYDLVRAPLDARDSNRAHAITVAPAALSSGQGGSLVPGLVVGKRF